MRDADQCLCALPCSQTLQIDHAVLGNDVLNAASGVSADGAVCQCRNDSALQVAVLVGERRAHADEALAALGQISAHNEVQLTAGSGDVLHTCGLCVDLTKQVHINSVVDGNEVIQLRDDIYIVGVVDRCSHDVRIFLDVIIQLVCAGREGEDLTALVHRLVHTRDLASLCNIHEAIDIHLGVNTQILQIGFSNQSANSVGHAADTQLQACAVGDLRNDQLSHLAVHIRRRNASHLRHTRIVAFHDCGYILDVDLCTGQTENLRHVLVDLDDDMLRFRADISQMRRGRGEGEVTEPVHGRTLHHDHVYRIQVFSVKSGQFRVTHRHEVAHALLDDLAVDSAAVPGVPCEMVAGIISFCDLRHPHCDAAADLHVCQFTASGSQRLVQRYRMIGTPSVIHPVTGLDDFDSFLCSGQLRLIHFLIIHIDLPPIIVS